MPELMQLPAHAVAPPSPGEATAATPEHPGFNELWQRYNGLAANPNYVPTIGEFKELGVLADNITQPPRLEARGWEEQPETIIPGPQGQKLKADAVRRIKTLADPATWVNDEITDGLFARAANEWRAVEATPAEVRNTWAFNEHEKALDGLLSKVAKQTDLNPDPGGLDRMADLSRAAKERLARHGVDVERILQQKTAARHVKRAVGRAKPEVTYSQLSEGSLEGAGKRAWRVPMPVERPAEQLRELDNETALVRLLKDGFGASEQLVAGALYPEKMAGGVTVYGKWRRKGENRNGGLSQLSKDELDRVQLLTRQLSAAERLERTAAQDYRNGVKELPPGYQISRELFPGQERRLLPMEDPVILAVKAKLQNVRGEEEAREARLEARFEQIRASARAFGETGRAVTGRAVQFAGAVALALGITLSSMSVAAEPKSTAPSAVATGAHPYRKQTTHHTGEALAPLPSA